jgi:hypothetical protein
MSLQLAWNEEHQRKEDIESNREPRIDQGEQYGNGVKNGIHNAS